MSADYDDDQLELIREVGHEGFQEIDELVDDYVAKNMSVRLRWHKRIRLKEMDCVFVIDGKHEVVVEMSVPDPDRWHWLKLVLAMCAGAALAVGLGKVLETIFL